MRGDSPALGHGHNGGLAAGRWVMSLSRALATLNDAEFREAMYTLATTFVVKGQGRKRFERMLKPIFHTFHAAGWTRERLAETQRIARREFQNAKLAHTKQLTSQ
jgi:hypothetical protein